MTAAAIYSLIICGLGAILEGLLAGAGVRERMAQLRQPRLALPFWGWTVIGALYYLVCFAILHRLFSLSPSFSRNAAFGLIGTIMFMNALWNYFFFRARNLFHAWLLGAAYSTLALALLILLLGFDQAAALWFSPYVLYLFYANFWGYRIWQLNRADAVR